MKVFFLLVLTASALVACDPRTEDSLVTPQQATTENTDFTAQDAFDWSTMRKVQLTVTGFKTDLSIQKMLVIRDSQGNTVYQGVHLISEQLTLLLTVPATEQALKAEFGSIKAELPIQANQAHFVLCANCQ